MAYLFYFVYCNGLKDKDRFDEKLDFNIREFVKDAVDIPSED